MPDNQRVAYLLEKYGAGQCTAQELNELSDWYEALSLPGHEGLLLDGQSPETREKAQQYYRELKAYLESTGEMEPRRPKRTASWYRVAAAAVFFLFIGGGAYYFLHREQPPIIEVAQSNLSNDWVRLPDGSVVVLKPGSSIRYDSSNFGNRNREVTLQGEAYFDVIHKEQSPFVVHAGNIRTTVLGTAFTVRTGAGGKTVSVSVTRGKVKVEDIQQHKTLAILTEGKAVDYTVPIAGSKAPPVAAVRDFHTEEVIQWVAADLQFESLPLSVVVERLSVRYHTSIRLAHPDIGNCIISMTAPFEGTESLEQVLTVLCGTLNDTYRVTDTGILIEGTGCEAK